MKVFKRIDTWLQAILTIGILISGCIDTRNLDYFYFVVGGVQLLSILVHLAFPRAFYASPMRRHYGNALLILIGAGFLMLISPLLLVYFFIIAIVTPVYAVWYFCICCSENELIRKKAFIHLK